MEGRGGALRCAARLGRVPARAQMSASRGQAEIGRSMRAFPLMTRSGHCFFKHCGAASPNVRLSAGNFRDPSHRRALPSGAGGRRDHLVLGCDRTALYLRIPAANQLPPPLTMSRTGLVQGVGGTGARTPSIRKSPLGSSGMRTESCITPGAGPQNNLARTL